MQTTKTLWWAAIASTLLLAGLVLFMQIGSATAEPLTGTAPTETTASATGR